jgi:hypothetical protein
MADVNEMLSSIKNGFLWGLRYPYCLLPWLISYIKDLLTGGKSVENYPRMVPQDRR